MEGSSYELSFLTKEEQAMLVETMDYEQTTPSLSQAQRMKKLSQIGKLTEDSMLAIMPEEKKRLGQGDVHYGHATEVFTQKLHSQSRRKRSGEKCRILLERCQ